MGMRLEQKHWLKGTQTFELDDDVVHMTIKAPFKEEKRLDVVLSILNPEPVVNRSMLEFHSRVKCGPLMSLYIDNPNPEAFNAFVEAVKTKALQEFNIFAGVSLQK